MDKKVKRLIAAAQEIIGGNHLWDYHEYIQYYKGKKTNRAVQELEESIADLKEKG